MPRILRTAALGLAVALATPLPASAQSDAASLEALDAQLPGKLVNDPSRIDWESYGPEFHAESFQDDNLPGGAARRFHINRATEHIYTAGTNIPLTKTVRRGEQVTIGFWARTVESTEDDGRGVLRVRFQKDEAPYPGFGEETLSIGTEWDWYEVTAEAEQTLRSKDGIVAIQFGRTKQVLEIGQAIIVTGASAIASAEAAPAKPKPVPAKPLVATLPPPLKDAGALLNDPAKGDWNFTAGSGQWELREGEVLWGSAVNRVTSRTSSDTPSALAVTIPVAEAVSEGDNLLIAIAARTESTASVQGKAFARVRVKGSGITDEAFSDNIVGFGDNWQLVRVNTRAPKDFGPGEAQVILHLGQAEQVMDLGPVYVVKTSGQ